MSIVLNKTDLPLCPVTVLLAYLVVRGNRGSTLFMSRGQPLPHSQFVSDLWGALPLAGHKLEKYAGYSFHIRTATTAAACGVPVDVINTLGRWKSQAYQLYIKIPDTQLTSISKSLAGTREVTSGNASLTWGGGGSVGTGQVSEWT